MGVGTKPGRHQAWSPSWILPRIRNQFKRERIGNFLCLKCKGTHKQILCTIASSSYAVIVETS